MAESKIEPQCVRFRTSDGELYDIDWRDVDRAFERVPDHSYRHVFHILINNRLALGTQIKNLCGRQPLTCRLGFWLWPGIATDQHESQEENSGFHALALSSFRFCLTHSTCARFSGPPS